MLNKFNKFNDFETENLDKNRTNTNQVKICMMIANDPAQKSQKKKPWEQLFVSSSPSLSESDNDSTMPSNQLVRQEKRMNDYQNASDSIMPSDQLVR